MYYPEEAFFRRSQSVRGSEEEDPRSPFARDRDRLIYSSAFRRLSGKSQVVASTEIGPFHTRLTHSLKVAQLGRRLAEQIRTEQGKSHPDELDGKSPGQIRAPDPGLVEFACLAHDIGHPPFGHNGEEALHQAVDHLVGEAVHNLLQGFGEKPGAVPEGEAQRYIGGFEGNPQTFRIVTRLSHKAFPGDSGEQSYLGLDLTAAAICAVSKYPWGRETLHIAKWGAYGAIDDRQSDYYTLNETCKKLGWDASTSAKGATKSFECQLMDWCDDVTYAVHDVEDFYMIGMIPLERIFHYGKLFAAMHNSSQEQAPQVSGSPRGEKRYPETDEWCEFREHLQEKWKNKEDHWGDSYDTDEDYLNFLRSDLMDNAYGSTGWDASPGSIKARRFSHRRASDLITHFASRNVRCDGLPLLNIGTLALAEGGEEGRRDQEKKLRYQCDMLKELIWKYVINMPNLKTQQAGQRRIISDLVEMYASDIELLPPDHIELAKEGAGYSKIPGIEEAHKIIPRLAEIRIAADYVSSLTEPQALALHKRLTGVELGGFRDFV